jgi:hypothetical protein
MKESCKDYLNHNRSMNFNELLFSYIDELGCKDSEIYKKVDIDRKLFSKIRCLSDATAAIIYSCFYCGIYILSLVGGIIADRTQNYKGTIQAGLVTMATGYILLAIPITATDANQAWLLPLTCFALLMIAFGNGLFKGNLQAIVGQLYDNFEAEEAKKGEEALKLAKDKRDSGFQIFYVFINVGGLIAPFVAPLIRSWWLKVNGFIYNAKLPALCHEQLNGTLSGDRIKTALHFNRFKGLPISIIRQTSFLWMEGYQMVIAALIAVGFKYFAKKKSTAV